MTGSLIAREFMTSAIVDAVAHVRVGMQCSVLALRHRDGGKLLGRHAVLVHVAPSDERISGRHAEAVGLLEFRMADLCEQGRRAARRQTGEPVVPGHDQNVATHACLDERRRQHDGGGRGRAAGLHGCREARLEPHILAEDRC
ncbi:MAG: hypothetical protein WAL02_14245, partial [Rhodoplanes sp.]